MANGKWHLPAMLRKAMQAGMANGFTLIELLVVVSLMSILMLTSVITFSSFTKSQSFQTSVSDVVALLNKAKSKSLNQVKPVVCGVDSLQGYLVGFTALGSTYDLGVKCGNKDYVLETKKLPPQITFAEESATSVFFNVATGVVDLPVSVVITGFDNSKAIDIDSVGNISVQ